MRILALETSGIHGSVAILDDSRPRFERDLDPSQRTARTLVPAIAAGLEAVGWSPSDIEWVVVTEGPGSFTGLRIGVTTAKTFAYATGANLIGVNTLSVIAHQVPAAAGTLWAVLNAEREQLFAASYVVQNGIWIEQTATQIVDGATWLSSLAPGMLVTGPGLGEYVDRLPSGITVVDRGLWIPRAAEVGREGLRELARGSTTQWWSLLPKYFRESAAVEKARGQLP